VYFCGSVEMAELSFSGADKDQLVVSLAALVCADSKVDITADNISAVISGSGNSVASYWAPLFATYIEQAGGVSKFFSAPGSGGGSAPAAGNDYSAVLVLNNNLS
jgi:ribosomal protein L12E/L44/L45/RPP1/RPP2